MTPVDPCIDPRTVPEGSRPILIAKNQDEFITLPAVVTPNHTVITRWSLTEEERVAILAGAEIFLTIIGTPIRPVWLSVGPLDWTKS